MQGGMATLLRGAGIGDSPGARLLQQLQPLDRELQRIERFSQSGRAFAYCFCIVE